MKSSSHSITNSLKGRIWLAAGSLAVVDCILGLAAYLILSFLSADPFLTLFVTCVLLALATLAFGWLISKDILRPVEELALLARSLERSPSGSLPRTTGAIETDQLLQSFHKNGQQLRNLISVMDDVAAGKTEAATIPLEASDKLTASFQKLCTKVTDSISAKRELDELRTAVSQLSADVSKVRGGQLDVEPRSEQPETKDLANTLRFLTGRLTSLYQQVFASTLECDRAAAEARSSLQSILESIDQTALSRVISDLRSDQNTRLETAVIEFSEALKASSDLYDEFTTNGAGTERVASAAQQLQRGASETNQIVQKLRNRVSAISQLARNAQDISKRSNLIALNASIAANGNAAAPELLVSEIEDISTRSEELYRQLVLAGETLNSEIAAIEKGIASLTDVTPEISRSVNSSTQLVRTLFDQIARLGEIEQDIRTASDETRLENDKLRGVIDKLSDVSVASAMVRESESGIQRISSLVTGLRESVSDLKVSAAARPQTGNPEPLSVAPASPAAQGSASIQGSFDEMFVESSPSNSRPEPTLAPLPPSVKFPASSNKPANGFETLIDVNPLFVEN